MKKHSGMRIWLLIGSVCLGLIVFGGLIGLFVAHTMAVYGQKSSRIILTGPHVQRTFQTSAVVGHGGDSPEYPSLFVVSEVDGKITITETPAGNMAQVMYYTVPFVGDGSAPIVISFRDTRGSGRVDMLVSVGDKTSVFVNNGTRFVLQP